MTTPYTPSPIKLVEVLLPQDVIDLVAAESVNNPFVSLADGVAFRDYVASQSGLWSLSVATVADGDPFPFVASGSTPPGPGISDDGLEITLADAGTYFFACTARIKTDTTSTDFVGGLRIIGEQPIIGTTTIADIEASRWSADANVVYAIGGSGLRHLAAGTVVHLESTNGIIVDQSVTDGRLIMFRVN